MIDGLRPYPAMKDSGVPWLGEVPEHWKQVPGRSCLIEKQVSNAGMVEKIVLSLSFGRIVVKPEEKLTGLVPESFETYQVVDPGDIICRPTDLQNDHTSLRFGFSNSRGIITSAYMCLETQNQLDRRFGYLLLHAYDLKKVFYGLGSGLRQNLSWVDFKYLPCALPALPEQTAIVRFLDYVERRIRKYIRAKQRLIRLLEEQKQAIIHCVVTGQIDVRTGKPYPAYKDSGVEWLGDIPEHWEARQLSRMGRFTKGNGGTKEDEVSNGVPCIRYGDIYMHHKFFIRKIRSCITQERAVDYTLVHYGDVLFAGSGETIEEIGKSTVNLIESGACCGGDLILFRPSIDVEPQFMGYVTDCPQAVYQKSRMGRGITVMHIYGDQLKYLWIALPPMTEQPAIVKYLDKAIADIETAIDCARYKIELLCEYHTRLIADVVTGKVDVRGYNVVEKDTDTVSGEVRVP